MKKAQRDEVDRGDGIYCTIKSASDVPADPPNYFLARRLPSPERKKEKEVDQERETRRKERSDENGRRIKGRGSSRIDRAGTPPHWREGHTDRISMKDYRDREQQRAAEERWTKSIRQPEQDDIDPRVYGRYDDKADVRKKRESAYREKKQLIKRYNRRKERDDYYQGQSRGSGRSRSRSHSPYDRSPPRESKFNRRRDSDSDMSD